MNVSSLMTVYLANNYNYDSQNLSRIILILILYNYSQISMTPRVILKDSKISFFFWEWNTNIIAFHALFMIILRVFCHF